VAHARGDRTLAVSELGQALARFEASGMALHAAVANRRLGELLGGDEGPARTARADLWMATAGVADPAALVRMLAPGFTEPRALRS
jgi:hypothetical protein